MDIRVKIFQKFWNRGEHSTAPSEQLDAIAGVSSFQNFSQR